MKRIVYDICIFLGIFLLPWWAVFALCLLGIFLFNNFYEFIFVFLLNYAVYGNSSHGLLASNIYLPLILILVFFIVRALKRQFIFYKK